MPAWTWGLRAKPRWVAAASPELVTLRGAPALGLSPGSGSYRPVITVTVFTELLLCLDGSLLNQQIGRGRGLDWLGRMSGQREMGDVGGVKPVVLDYSLPICKSDSFKQ